RRDGVRVPSGGAATFGPRVQALALSAPQHRLVAPLLALLRPLNPQLAILEAQLARGVAGHAAARRLCTVPGVGPGTGGAGVGRVTAAAVVATLDDVGRFASAGHGSVRRVGAARAELGRAATPRAAYEGGHPPGAVAACPSRLGLLAQSGDGGDGPASVGGAAGRTPRAGAGRRFAGAAARAPSPRRPP